MVNTAIRYLSVTHMKTGNLLEDFVWQRARGGYVWKETIGGLLLVAADGKDAVEEKYRLGDKSSTGLFMQFAELDQTPDAFLAFANQFGWLGYPVTVDYVELSTKEFMTTSRLPTRFSESHNPPIAPFSFWKGKPPAKFSGRSRGPAIKGEFFSLDGDRAGESWIHHAKLIRGLIEARRTPPGKSAQSPLKFDADFAMRNAVCLTLDDQLEGRLSLVSLVGALWLQAALAGGKEYRTCPVCNTPIEISRTGGARADTVFCSDKCKSKDYRQRRATARSLQDKGVSLRKIAKQIDTDIETVKNWLK